MDRLPSRMDSAPHKITAPEPTYTSSEKPVHPPMDSFRSAVRA